MSGAAPLPATPGRSRRATKVAVVGVVAVGLFAAHRLGLLQAFAEPARVKQTLVDLGPWGQVAFVAAYAALQPFGVPGTVFILAAPLIWAWPVAFALSMAGTMAASVVGFSFTRFIARDWAAARIPARFRAYDDALARRGFETVATLRFLFWMPQALHAFFGVSKIPFWTHFWGSMVGYFVPLLLVAYFGNELFELLRRTPPAVWAGIAVALAVGLAGWLWRRRCRRGAPT